MSAKPKLEAEKLETEQSLLSHLIELRERLLHAVLGVAAIFFALVYFANDLYTWLARPLIAQLPHGSQMIAIDVISPFLTPLKFTLILSLFIAVPWVLYQIWAFIAPGLYRHEKRMVMPLLISSTLLFYLGALFAYYVVLPVLFGFLAATTPQGVEMATDISRYLDFVLTMFFAFGVAFEVPVATVLLVWTGVATPDTLVAQRPYIIVGAFVVAAVLTPPDVFSQIALALPMWLLFEIGVVVARIYQPQAEPPIEPEPPEPTPSAAQPQPLAGMPVYAEPYQPRSEAEMEAELDQIEAEAQAAQVADDLRAAEQALDHGDPAEAMARLSQVLRRGTPEQCAQARALLKRL